MSSLFVMGRRSLRLFFVTLAAALLLCPLDPIGAAPARKVRVEIPAVIYAADAALRLGDAARIEGPRQAREVLAALILSTEDGYLTRDEVLDAIGASGLDDLRVEVYMPARVRVELPGPEGNETDPERANPAGANPGGANPGGPSPRPSASPVSRPDVSLSSMVKSLAAWDGEVEVSTSGTVPPGRLVDPASIVPGTPAATLRFRGDDGRLRSLAVRLAWSQNVLVAARTIQRNVPITPTDLMVRSMKIGRPGVYAVDAAQVVGHLSRKVLKQGEPIPLELLSGPTMLKKGRKVRILARYGGLTAAAEGVLLEDGKPGDLVKVRRSDNKKVVLSAYIVNENTVEVRVQ